MDLGFVGLGNMGMNMVTRLRQRDHRVVVYDRALEAEDTTVDRANTKFHDDVCRASEHKARKIHYIDAGTSGGI